jgi:hypothetical protein
MWKSWRCAWTASATMLGRDGSLSSCARKRWSACLVIPHSHIALHPYLVHVSHLQIFNSLLLTKINDRFTLSVVSVDPASDQI